MGNDRCHDDRHLVAHWRQFARVCGLRLTAFTESGGYPVYCLQTHDQTPGGFYVSAGSHDEDPACRESLFRCVERST